MPAFPAAMRSVPAYGAAMAALVGLGALVGWLSAPTGEGSWYAGLDKSALTPPGWVFAVVWPCLYALLAIALVRAWRARDEAQGGLRRVALGLFLAQLALNYAWSFVFFSAERPALAFGWILAILVLASAACAALARLDRLAAVLMAPYLVWLAFAAWLAFAIVRLN